jgi:hypothetical protein
VIIRDSAKTKYKPNIGLSRMKEMTGADSSAERDKADKDS